MDEKNETEEVEPRGDYGAKGVIWELVKMVFWVIVIIVPLRVFLIQPFFVQGASMEPNFEDREYLIVNELGYKTTNVGFSWSGKQNNLFSVTPFKELTRGDVVVFRYPKNPSVYYIKRIIGLPGEKIEIKDDQVIISNSQHPDGFRLDETKYLDPSVLTSGDQTIQLTGSEYFVMGDNRMYSSDSRSWGPVPQEDVVGKVMLRAWPLNKAGIF